MYAKTIILLCAGNKVFVKYQAQGGVLPQNPPLRTPLFGNIKCVTTFEEFLELVK